MEARLKLEWNEANQRWLVKLWHPLKGRWYQVWDMEKNPWDCLTINWLGSWQLDKKIDNVYDITINRRNNNGRKRMECQTDL